MGAKTLHVVAGELEEWASQDHPRVPLGYDCFDSRTNGGIANGEVAMVMARTEVGKTWFAVNVMVNNPSTPCVFFSIEMAGRYVLERLAAVYTNTPASEVQKEVMETGGSEAIRKTVREMPHLWIDDSQAKTIPEMMEEVEALDPRPKLVVIDYLELIKSFGMGRMEIVDQLAWNVKEFARMTDTAVLVVHQVKRGEFDKGSMNQGHRPLTKTDARFGGEMAVDYQIGLYRPAMSPNITEETRYMMRNQMKFQILKNRNGPPGPFEGTQLYLDPDTWRMSDIRRNTGGMW